MSLEINVANRELVIDQLRRELVGPAPDGNSIDCSKPIAFADWKDSNGPWRDLATGEEILTRDNPTKRYGLGVLYPFGTPQQEEDLQEAGTDAIGLVVSSPELDVPNDVTEELTGQLDKARQKLSSASTEDQPDEFDLSLANSYRPSSVGVSFLADVPEHASLHIEAQGGRYSPIPVHIEVAKNPQQWWLRQPISISAIFDESFLVSENNVFVTSSNLSANNLLIYNAEGLDLRVEIYSRTFGENRRRRLITVCLVNRTEGTFRDDELCLFQTGFKTWIEAPDTNDLILPYPDAPLGLIEHDEEEQGLRLLYRDYATFAVGHGCAADWVTTDSLDRAVYVSAECLPVHETPSITPSIEDENGDPVTIPMAQLAGLVEGEDGMECLEQVIQLYDGWIATRAAALSGLDPQHYAAAQRHLDDCMRCSNRMKHGLDYLQQNPTAYIAFQLANRAILIQQVAGTLGPRLFEYDKQNDSCVLQKPYQEPVLDDLGEGQGMWRPFQIAFLLMSLESAVSGDVEERETVELIWFPTGGGKTEAYLGLVAFTLFMRRLLDVTDSGTHVLMRYTLRLLSTQQFQRAARLICAMEYLRQQNATILGSDQFSIGLWVGGSNTPNSHKEAVTALNALNDPKNRRTENKFIVDSCPWCGAQMGPIDLPPSSKLPRTQGYYKLQNKKVHFECPDPKCTFSETRGGLPIYVVDEDLYEQRPSMIIGTADKFAVLAWRPEARRLFGLDDKGNRICSPPGLIIQDELHLISGPLGSMVGLYEAVIEELCTDHRGTNPIKPKIISSTATIRRFRDQIKALYGRTDVVLFPPPGFDAGDSFFARYARRQDGTLLPGRKYLGIHAPGLGSLQTVQVRTFTALLQAPTVLPDLERDPWWTLMVFFNSLRELGTSLSLLESDILDYQRVWLNRVANTQGKWRNYWNILELTGRAASDEIPSAIAELNIRYPSNGKPYPIDVCLASSILEVGVDIPRLSVMAVVGQPKTTSQYIQVTGRVGRLEDRPGLIVTIYGASKPRDRSHFEKFRSYHEQLYAQVEPTSVTPFSPPALDRALHAVMVAYVRQSQDKDRVERPYPYPANVLSNLRELLLERVIKIDPEEQEAFKKVFQRRAAEWSSWERNQWSSWTPNENVLMYSAGSYVPPKQRNLVWTTPLSMRNVDSECITELLTHVEGSQSENNDA